MLNCSNISITTRFRPWISSIDVQAQHDQSSCHPQLDFVWTGNCTKTVSSPKWSTDEKATTLIKNLCPNLLLYFLFFPSFFHFTYCLELTCRVTSPLFWLGLTIHIDIDLFSSAHGPLTPSKSCIMSYLYRDWIAYFKTAAVSVADLFST